MPWGCSATSAAGSHTTTPSNSSPFASSSDSTTAASSRPASRPDCMVAGAITARSPPGTCCARDRTATATASLTSAWSVTVTRSGATPQRRAETGVVPPGPADHVVEHRLEQVLLLGAEHLLGLEAAVALRVEADPPPLAGAPVEGTRAVGTLGHLVGEEPVDQLGGGLPLIRARTGSVPLPLCAGAGWGAEQEGRLLDQGRVGSRP